MESTLVPSAVTAKPNVISSLLRQHIKEYEAKQAIEPGEVLTFEMMGSAERPLTAYKSTWEANEMDDAQRSRTMGQENMINGESILDPGTDEYVPLMYFKGGWSPGKTKNVLWFRGKDALTLVVNRRDNQALYLHMILSNYLEDNANPARVIPDGGCLYRLIRPTQAVERSWQQRLERSRVLEKIDALPEATLRLLAPKFGVAHPAGGTLDQLRMDFADFAGKDRNFERLRDAIDADETGFSAAVARFVQAQLVLVDAERHVWVLAASRATICPASPAASTTGQLVDFLLTEPGQITYKQLLALLAKADSAAKPPAAPAKK